MERNAGFKFLEDPTKAERVKKNWQELVRNTCTCEHCLRLFKQQLAFHLGTASLEESKHMTMEMLTSDIREIQTRRRAKEILAPVKMTRKFV